MQKMHLNPAAYSVLLLVAQTGQKSKFNYVDFVKDSPIIDIPEDLNLYTPHPPTVVVNGKTKARAGKATI